MNDDPLLTATEVAAWLQIHINRFYLRRQALEIDHGFPKPVPGLGLRWRKRAIQRWFDQVEIDSCSPGTLAERGAMLAVDAEAGAIAAAQVEMDRRAAGMRRVG